MHPRFTLMFKLTQSIQTRDNDPVNIGIKTIDGIQTKTVQRQ